MIMGASDFSGSGGFDSTAGADTNTWLVYPPTSYTPPNTTIYPD